MSEPISPDRCPSDRVDVAEMYCLNRLSGQDKAAFEIHYITCPKCADEVEMAQAFIEAAKAAARLIKRDKPED